MITGQGSVQQTEFFKACGILVESREKLQQKISVLTERIRDITRPSPSGPGAEGKMEPREKRSNVIDFIQSETDRINTISATVQQVIESLDI